MATEPQRDLPQLIRAGVRAQVGRLAKVAGQPRRWSPPLLLAALSAGAFAPLLLPVLGDAALLAATIGAVTSVGGNVLTDVIKTGVQRLRYGDGSFGGGDPLPGEEELAAVLERQLRQVLQSGTEQADWLRADIAKVLRETGAIGTVLQAAVESGDRLLQSRLTEGLAELGEQFDEFAFVLAEVRGKLQIIQESVDSNSADLQVSVGLHYRQATDIRLLLERVALIERRIVGRPAGMAPATWQGAPYKGLLPFDETDDAVFHGRETLTAELLSTLSRRLSLPRLLVVTGASGAGKSSLLRAGLLPAINRGELTGPARHWPRHVLARPTRSPLTGLANLLAGLAGVPAPDVLDHLTAHPQQAHLLVRQAVEHDARRRGRPEPELAGSRLVLVVDQFEEIFTMPDGAGERAAFITALHAAATTPGGAADVPPALVLVAVRGDFIDRCADHQSLAEALASPFIVGPMTEPDLRRAIIAPADAAGLEIEQGLPDAILAELRGPAGRFGAGVLPLLSQAMLITWEHREGNRLTSRGYGQAGGVGHAVASSADDAYQELDTAGQAAARQLFHQLTVVSAEGSLARRPAPVAELAADPAIDNAMHVFARRRLLVIDADNVQIAHDVLLEAWPQLRGWVEADLAGHALYSQLLDDADAWDTNGRRTEYLYRGERLAGLLRVMPRWQATPDRYPALPGVPRTFLRAAQTACIRASRLRRILVGVLVTLVVLASTGALMATNAQQNANRQRDDAVARRLAAHAQLIAGDPSMSAMLAVASARISPASAEARASLLAVLHQPHRHIFPEHEGGVNVAAFSPHGGLLATTSGVGVRLWEVATHRQVGVLAQPGVQPTSLAFNPDGRILATAQDDAVVRLWDVATRRPLGTLTDPEGDTSTVAFSPDGRLLAGTSRHPDREHGWVRLWDVASREQVGVLAERDGSPTSVSFSPDGRTVASTHDGIGGIELWDVLTHQRIAVLPDHGRGVEQAVFSPNGKLMASASGNRVRLWNVASGKQIGEPLVTALDAVLSVAFSRDGRIVAGAGTPAIGQAEGGVHLWDVATGAPLGSPLTPAGGRVASLSFSPDSRTLAGASVDAQSSGTIRLWDVAVHAQIAPPFIDPLGEVRHVAFSPDGRVLAALSTSVGEKYENGDRIRLLDAVTHEQSGASLVSPAERVTSLALSPDGRILATGGAPDSERSGTVRLWDMASRTEIAALDGPRGYLGAVGYSPDGKVIAGLFNQGEAENGPAEVWLWNTATGNRAGQPLRDPKNSQTALAFSPDSRSLAISSPYGGVQLWDVATGSKISDPLVSTGGALSAVFAPDGHTLAVVGVSGEVRLWDVDRRQQKGLPLNAQTERLSAAAFSPDGRTLATIGETSGQVWMWDLATHQRIGAPLVDTTNNPYTLTFSPDGRTLVVAGSAPSDNSRGNITFWDITVPTDLIAAVCAIAGRSLTRAEWTQYVPEVGYRPTCGGA
ncbi:hypothetical protein GCM10022419_135160 [Nonomuraea rosea]|uniref:Novel STAND NTPase 1 domain-containing protein n=1 Tax=Nonomuraea rosea TaxID=638574 RepID=A0ABP7A875_9ACTN